MPEGFPPGLKLTPADWPEGKPDGPGRQAVYLPQGFLLGPPNVVFPYRDMASDDYYGAQEPQMDPFANAPLQDPCGGTVYFETTDAEKLKALVRMLMGHRADRTNYVAFAFSSSDPVSDRYLDQLKIVSHNALTTIFKIDEEHMPGEQGLTIEEAMVGFVAAQSDKWNDEWTFSRKLSGSAGGDDDWAKESLAFGLHVENTYWGAYRIWSRPWLVTK